MMRNSETSPRKNGMLPVLLAFFLAVAAAVLTVEISSALARDKIRQQADADAESHANYLMTMISTVYKSTRWNINSFLSSMVAIQYDTVGPEGVNLYRYVMDEDTRRDLSVDDLYQYLESFINYNYDFHSAVFVFEPGVISDAPPRGIAAQMMPGDTVRHELIGSGCHILDGSLYRKTASSRGMGFYSGAQAGNDHWLSTMTVPIHLEDGRFIGEFWVDLEPEYTSDLLRRYGSERFDISLLVDSDMHVISSSRASMNGRHLLDAVSSAGEKALTQKWYSQAAVGIHSQKPQVLRFTSDGVSSCTYTFPFLSFKTTLVIVQREDRIYESLSKFKFWLFIISAAGLMAVLSCISFIVLAFHRKIAQNRRMESELRTASAIQQGILPGNPGPAQLPSGIKLYGYQHPAKEVGGDFYDYALIGSRLYFCIGDVSGKGVPAALVMSQLCSLFRYVIRTQTEPRDIVTSINKAVMDRSDDSMMCTLLAGVLDVTSGRLNWCNAGHTPPIRISAGGASAGYMKVLPNMPLYAFENWNYVQESTFLQPGDRLFLYTDGVTESMNRKNEFYGDASVLKSVTEYGDKPFPRLVDGVLEHIRTFVGNALQHDDITILCIGYDGGGSRRLHYEHVPKDVTGIVDEVLSACSREGDMRLRLALEEPVQNIADYAYPDTENDTLDILVDSAGADGELTFTLIDSGIPFNPLEGPLPDLSLPLDQRHAGGLGIYFTRRIMKDISYTYMQNRNHLKLTYQTKP